MGRYGCGDDSRRESAGNRSQTQAGYRTLCVRKCDGYYFPIGFSTPMSELNRDQAACGSFYPDGAAELYVYPSGSEDQQAMMSLDGEAYAEQPFAFAYRSAYQPACAATLHAGVKAAEEGARQAVAIKASVIVPIPVPRPSLTDPKTIVDAPARTRVVAADRRETTVRVVGPATPYLVSKLADGSIAPVAANSAPKRVATEPGIGTPWLDRISALIAPAAQADEGD
jgi:hypothetical protein